MSKKIIHPRIDKEIIEIKSKVSVPFHQKCISKSNQSKIKFDRSECFSRYFSMGLNKYYNSIPSIAIKFFLMNAFIVGRTAELS